MLLKFLEIQEQMKRKYPEMIELGNQSIIGTWNTQMTQILEEEINSKLESIYSKIELLDMEFELITDLLVTYNPKFNVSKLADIFMKISDLKSTSMLARDTFGPKS